MPRTPLDIEIGSKRFADGSIKVPPEGYVRVGTNNNFESEAWSLIRHFVLHENTWQLNKTQKNNISTLISRAELFYDKYEAIYPDPSAALLGYYFAMNLAKAFLIANNTNYIGKKFMHGLSFDAQFKQRISSKSVNRTVVNLFPAFYKLTTQKVLADSIRFNIDELFSSMSETTFQAAVHKIKNHLIRIEYAFLTDRRVDDDKKVWPVIRFMDVDLNTLKQNKTMLRRFNRYFEKVDFNANERGQYFSALREEMLHSAFFQSKKQLSLDNPFWAHEGQKIVHDAFEQRVEVNVFDDDINFDIHIPFKGRKELRLNELLCSYASLYWCSSVVRYDPTIDLLGGKYSKYRTIYDEVNRNSPYLVLRGMLSLFSKRKISMYRRS